MNPEQFWSKVDKTSSEKGCWLWTGAIINGTKGGQLRVDGKRIQAHRYSWLLEHGSLPDGLCVCHHCDVPHCVRPSHLFLGTHQANMADMSAKNRRAGRPWRNSKVSELTGQEVMEIREGGLLLEEAKSLYGVRATAIRYGISEKSVYTIRYGTVRTDVGVEPKS